MHEALEKMHQSPKPPIELLWGGSYSAPKGRDFPPHSHRVTEMVYYTAGRARCLVGHDEYAGTPGTLLITPPGVVHSEVATTAYSNYYLSLNTTNDSGWPVCIVDTSSLGFNYLFARIVEELRVPRADGPEMLRLLGDQLLLTLTRARYLASEPYSEQLVARAEALIEQYHVSPIRVASLARELGCSPSSLRAHFAARRNKSPRESIQRVRLRHALDYVRSSTLTIAAIAERCGYDSASHLSRHIKSATGVNPGMLRRDAAPGSRPADRNGDGQSGAR